MKDTKLKQFIEDYKTLWYSLDATYKIVYKKVRRCYLVKVFSEDKEVHTHYIGED
jgi:hypothetical protein